MWNVIAGAFASIGMLFGGLFGGHHGPPPNASSTQPWANHASSTAPWGPGRTGSTTPWGMGSSTPGHMSMMMPGIFGTVASIDGTTLTVTGHNGPNTATTTYTVDASNAKVVKAGKPGQGGMASSTESVTDIQVNDTVLVTGTVSGTDVTAKVIIDGVMPMMGMPGMHMGHASSTMPMMHGKSGQQASSTKSWWSFL